MDQIRVIIIDDHPLFRQGLRQLLEKGSRFMVCAEAESGPQGLALIQKEAPDVAIIDVNLPGLSGLEITRQLQAERSSTRVVILTMNKDEDTFNRAMDFGALGFVLKENAVQDILNSVTIVARGEHYLSPTISHFLMRRRSKSDLLSATKPGIDDLTKAERRILRMISEKMTSRDIATELSISLRTVEAHRANICAKLNLRGTHCLLQFALENRSALV